MCVSHIYREFDLQHGLITFGICGYGLGVQKLLVGRIESLLKRITFSMKFVEQLSVAIQPRPHSAILSGACVTLITIYS